MSPDGNDEKPFQRVNRRLACSNSKFDVFFDELRTDAGHSVTDFLIVRPKVRHDNLVGGVVVLPELDGRIGLMRGYRHQLDQVVWQAPAGFVEQGEPTPASALRELEEETVLTCSAEDLVGLGTIIPDAGLIECKVALFVARNARPAPAADREIEPGSGRLKFFSREELADLIQVSDAIGSSTLIACFRYLALRR